MAITFDTSSEASLVNPGTSNTWSHTCTGSNLILIVCAWTRSSAVPTATYNGVSMTHVDTLGPLDGNDDHLNTFYLLNPATGANNVVVSLSISALIGGIGQSYTGTSQSSQPNIHTTNGPTTTASLTTSETTTVDNCWGVLFARGTGSGATSAGTGSTFRIGTAGFFQGYDSNGPKTPAGSQSMTVTTASSEPIGAVMLSIAPFGAATTNSNFFMFM